MNAQFKYEYFREFGKMPPSNFDSPLDNITTLSNVFKLAPEEAVKFFQSKGYAITYDWKAKAAEFHKQSFTVAKVMQADLLQFYKNEIQKAIDTGSTLDEFKQNINSRLEESGWKGSKEVTDPVTGEKSKVNLGAPSRLKTIYQTNLQSAYQTGRYNQMKETAKNFPYGMYSNADPKSDICQAVKDKVVRLDDPNLRLPPLHFNCKTTLDPISAREARRSGLIVVDASSTYNKGGGVQEAFDAHPDKKWEPDTTKYDDDIAAQLSKVVEGKSGGEGQDTAEKKQRIEELRKRIEAIDSEIADLRGKLNDKSDEGFSASVDVSLYVDKYDLEIANLLKQLQLKNQQAAELLKKVNSPVPATKPVEVKTPAKPKPTAKAPEPVKPIPAPPVIKSKPLPLPAGTLTAEDIKARHDSIVKEDVAYKGDYKDFLKGDYKTYLKKQNKEFTPEEIFPVYDYTVSGYRKINDAMITGKTDINNFKTKIEMIAATVSKLKAYTGNVSRGISLEKSQKSTFDSIVNQIKSGTYSNNAFMSTSSDETVSSGFASKKRGETYAIKLNIVSKTGRDIAQMSGFGESEILFLPGTKFTVQSYELSKDKKTIIANLVED